MRNVIGGACIKTPAYMTVWYTNITTNTTHLEKHFGQSKVLDELGFDVLTT